MDNNFDELFVKPIEIKTEQNKSMVQSDNEMMNLPPQNAPAMAPQAVNVKKTAAAKKNMLRDMWEKVEVNMPPKLDDAGTYNKAWAKNKFDKFIKADEEKKISAFDNLHNTENHSKRFKEIIKQERGNIRYMDVITDVPGEEVFGSEYKGFFSERLTKEKREKKITNKKSRLYIKNENANLVENAKKEFQKNSFLMINRAITKQAQRCDEEDYHDLAMFMKEGKDKENIHLVNLYLGKSVKIGPGGFEGQDVQLALDHMAGQLFAINISELKFNNDADMAKNAPEFERLAGQVAAFDRLSAKHNFMDRLDEKQKERLNERLESLRSIASYYMIRKDIICDKYYKTHYNDELSLDVAGASNAEQRAVGEKLVKSLILGRNMLGLNGINIYMPQFKGKFRYTDEKSLDIIKNINNEYSKKGFCKENTLNAHKSMDATALKELMKCKKRLETLNRETPLKEQENIQKTMDAVMEKAFEPVQRPDARCGTYEKIKNRLMLGYRFLVRSTIGAVSALLVNLVTGTEAALFEKDRRKKGQKKRDHLSVPGRKGEVFEEEIVRKNDEGEDLDIYSDVRRGPLVWEKLSAGDPDDPPEVTIMIKQAQRGNSASTVGTKIGHAMIGLSYSRYCKATKKKERYKLKFGYYPGGGLFMGTGLSMLGDALVTGRIDNDADHDYDVSRRYQVKPGDINKILRAAETYSDKGYNYFKRNCTTFVADMAKLINLPAAKELKEDEMKFEGKEYMGIQTLLAGTDSGLFMGANAISSRMVKADLNYLNFGQNRCTEEELDNYYKSLLKKNSLIKKGYTPGLVGETLRYSKEGELGALYGSDKNVNLGNLRLKIAKLGSDIWAKIDLRRKGPLTEQDEEAMWLMIGVNDASIKHMYDNEKTTTPAMVREAHKIIRNAMRKLNKYYIERLGCDAKLNADFMKLFSLFECALIFADNLYERVVNKEVKGDAGKLRYDFNHEQAYGYFKDKNRNKIEFMMTQGEYEGLLLAHKSPEEAIRIKKRYDELTAVKYDDLTDEQQSELNKLSYTIELAKDFANANRYILEKDEFSEKDIKYAFHELPQMEVDKNNINKFGGDFFEHYRPSFAYQGVILEKIFGGFRQLKLEKYPEAADQIAVLDKYILECFEKNPEMIGMILKWFLEGNEKHNKQDKITQAELLAGDFLAGLEDSCLRSAYSKVKGFGGAYFCGLMASMFHRSRSFDFLKEEIIKIKFPEGVE